MTRLIFAILLALWPASGFAQQVWLPLTSDNGDVFFGTVALPNRAMAFSCGERSPMRPDWQGTQALHPTVTAPGMIELRLSKEVLGPPRDELANETRSLTIYVGATAVQLPPARFNYFDDGWLVEIPATDPIFGAFSQGGGFQIESLLGRVNLSTNGLEGAFMQLVAFCEAKFNDLGLEWESAPSIAPSAAATRLPAAQNDAMVDVAYAHVAQLCGGPPSDLGPGHLMIGNIDGDGLNDVVIWWGAVDCGFSTQNPACQATGCQVETFLTAAWRGGPERVLASSASIIRDNSGRDVLQITAPSTACLDTPSLPDCTSYYGWQGGRFVLLN